MSHGKKNKIPLTEVVKRVRVSLASQKVLEYVIRGANEKEVFAALEAICPKGSVHVERVLFVTIDDDKGSLPRYAEIRRALEVVGVHYPDVARATSLDTD